MLDGGLSNQGIEVAGRTSSIQMMLPFALVAVMVIPARSANVQNIEGDMQQTQDTSAVEHQRSDSLVSDVIPPEGSTIELAGFAWVAFPAGAFDSVRVVTLKATSNETERDIFEFSVGTQRAAHEIRIITGATAPALPIDVGVYVPTEFLGALPTNKVPVLFVREFVRSANESMPDYTLLRSEFDPTHGLLEASVPPEQFLQRNVGRQIILVISSAINRE